MNPKNSSKDKEYYVNSHLLCRIAARLTNKCYSLAYKLSFIAT